jgi:peptidyl-tRNA hydrolase, PTH1 family
MTQNPPATDTPYLIVGLGNPGSRFMATRHNVGFAVVDEVAQRHGLRFSTRQANAELARGQIAGTKVILAKPQTFMNLSGHAVRGLAGYYKIPVDHILIIYDEIALPVGTLRIREKGSSAGHNGVNSVIQQMGTQNVSRIRVGVDRPVHEGRTACNRGNHSPRRRSGGKHPQHRHGTYYEYVQHRARCERECRRRTKGE